MRAFLSNVEIAVVIGRSNAIEICALRAAFNNYEQNSPILVEILQMFSNSKLWDIFTRIIASKRPQDWDNARKIFRLFLQHTRSLQLRVFEPEMFRLAVVRNAWPVLVEMQSLMNVRVLFAYLIANNVGHWNDTIPDAARQILIKNASLDELSEICAQFQGTHITGSTTYLLVAQEEEARQQKRRLAIGMMSHERLGGDSGPWQQSAAQHKDVMATIGSFL